LALIGISLTIHTQKGEVFHSFLSANHLKELSKRAETVAERFDSLAEPTQIRDEHLREAKALFRWMKDADGESAWIREATPSVGGTALPDFLPTADSLDKKNAELEAEMDVREAPFHHLFSEADRLVTGGDFASPWLRERWEQLADKMTALRQKSAQSKAQPADTLLARQYFSDAYEAGEWLRDRSLIVSHQRRWGPPWCASFLPETG